jgi:hypothetical protein
MSKYSPTALRIAHDFAIEHLTADGDLRVPCSRYGTHSSDCADVAWQAAIAHDVANGDESFSEDSLDYLMGLVVNDHDDIAYLIGAYHPDEEWRSTARDEWGYVDPFSTQEEG